MNGKMNMSISQIFQKDGTPYRHAVIAQPNGFVGAGLVT